MYHTSSHARVLPLPFAMSRMNVRNCVGSVVGCKVEGPCGLGYMLACWLAWLMYCVSLLSPPTRLFQFRLHIMFTSIAISYLPQHQ